MMMLVGTVLLTVALSGPALAFVPIGGGASSHITITDTALLNKVKETCKAVAEDAGHAFEPTGNSPEEIVQACLGPTATGEVSGAKFNGALQEIYTQNGLVDRDFVNSTAHHFNSEAFLEGKGLITKGVGAIKANIRIENFQAARKMLGKVLHTLQDFYSHSNWVELGHKEPYLNLIRPNLPIENIADVRTPTCTDCSGGSCPNPILPNILKEKKLTSGYMGISSATKPTGKCSHGGQSDLTSAAVPRGGIHKDERRADNQVYHDAAVTAATAATSQLLQDIRLAAGDEKFLRMLGIARSSVVCFVVDTTGSMSNDIAAAQSVMNEIIDSKRGTQDEPSEYILVPFNDPEFGPVIKTSDAAVIKQEISKLKADGGGDNPEMCFSGLQLALTTAPDSSYIYVFTDAEAKDGHLKDTIDALIRTTKSTVSFFMTTSSRRRRRRSTIGSFNDYRDLAQASGGQAIQVTKGQLPQATVVILDTSTSALVTVLQQARNPGKIEVFSFKLDDSLKNTTIYVTGTSISFTLTNPSGVTQTSGQTSGPLGSLQTVGNLWRMSLSAVKETGTWQININSNFPYSVKVTGQSAIAFIYDFVEKFEGPHPGYAVVTGRPQAGQAANLMVSVMGRKGPTSMEVKEVGLVLSRSGAVSNGTTTDLGNGDILVTVDAVPEGEFVVILKGTDAVSNTAFQRQSTTQMSVSKVNIQATVGGSVEPGKEFTIPFSVLTNGAGGQYNINAKNDRKFPMKFPSSLILTAGQYTNAALTITPPANTESGTDVTLTLDAAQGSDSNYVVLRLSVIKKITDFVPPLCEIVSIVDNCPDDVSQCKTLNWELAANLTDGNGTGIESVTLHQGNGNLSQIVVGDPAQYMYNASCCSQVVEIVAVDKVGNVGKCYHSIERSQSAPAPRLSVLLLLALWLSSFILAPH